MTISFLISYFKNYNIRHKSQGGAEYQAYLTAKFFLKKGYNVNFISIGDRDEIIKKDRFTIYYIKGRNFLRKFGKAFFFDFYKIFKILNTIEPDIIYQRTAISWCGLGAYWAKINNKTFIYFGALDKDFKKNTLSIDKNYLFNSIDRKIYEYGLKEASYVVCQSEEQSYDLKNNFGINSDLILRNVHKIPNSLYEKSDIFTIVWVANFHIKKRPSKFIELANKLREDDIKLIMIGRPAEYKRQKKYNKDIKNLNNLKYLGFIKQKKVNKVINKSHLLINTSDYEGFPNTFIQAWMRRVPVVSLNVDPDNVIKDNNIGYCTDGNLKKMQSKIKLLKENHGLYSKMANNAYSYALKNHSLNNIEKLIRLIEDDK